MDYTFYGASLGNSNAQQVPDTTSINIRNNTGKAGSTATDKVTFEGVVVSGMAEDSRKLENNTYASLIKEADDVKEQIMASAEGAKIGLKALFNRLNGSEAVRIDEDGFNLNDATEEEMVSIIDKIKIELAAYCDDYKVTGSSVSNEKIREVVGNQGMADEISSKMQNAGLPLNEDNINDIASSLEKINIFSKREPVGALSEETKNYMVSKSIQPTVENVCMTENMLRHAGKAENNLNKTADSNLTDREWEQLKPQVQKVIADAGLELNVKNLDNAKAFIKEGIPVTVDTLLYKAQLDKVSFAPLDIAGKIINNMAAGKSASSAIVTDDTDIIKEVTDALNILENLDRQQVVYAVKKAEQTGQDISLRSIEEACAVLKNNADAADADYSLQASELHTESNVETNYRKLLEIQILMTASSGMHLAREGVSITAISISTLHKQLMAYDRECVMEKISRQLADDVDSERIDYIQSLDTRRALYDISHAPDVIIGSVLKNSDNMFKLQLSAFAESGSSLRERFKRAGETYEAVGTKVRRDLGDSFNRALSESSRDILDSLNLENTKANVDAVRILSYNSMEITKERIEEVKELHTTLNSLINNMTPEKVLKMIRDKINPMTADIHVVDEYLNNSTIQNDEADAEKYSTFLYKLDRTDGINANERRQFIGIYKMMNMFTKDAGAAIGSLIKQNADITMENLCMAYNSRRHSGTDVFIDDKNDIKVAAKQSYYMHIFDETSAKLTPLTLKNVNDDKKISARSVENFAETVNQMYDADVEAGYYDEYIEKMRQLSDVDDYVLKEIENAGEPVTLNNIEAVKQLMQAGSFAEIVKNSRRRADAFIEKLDEPDELEKEYAALKEESDTQLAEAVRGSGIVGEEDADYETINNLRLINRQIGFISKLSLRHDYNVPFMTADGSSIGMIKLTLVSDKNEKGKISIHFEDNDMGTVSVEAKVNGTNMDIFGICSNNRDVLYSKLENAAQKITEDFGIDQTKVYCISSEIVGRVTYEDSENNRANSEMYRLAKTIILSLV